MTEKPTEASSVMQLETRITKMNEDIQALEAELKVRKEAFAAINYSKPIRDAESAALIAYPLSMRNDDLKRLEEILVRKRRAILEQLQYLDHSNFPQQMNK